ncbi:3-deoxy-8-phosphooctulonate synthase [Rickettsia felis str. Pedreira]|uniref:2-dehydro-3-deoxyphosphooctonate aldolase n=2 Tax=Rickettsia felis TaxID=42862 RepID=KDSA_RICFE|nr:3-deoxy-8-phosphooctulonate synthase [Rickettsia felis]Q4UN94.1 RecName: Full=2-dehydro-3-deoxyphosphooctonate aldolase; AltName: Full=3-deoxy-D-manno-octulosonic acid 8-phosphate synthase; AltName: Full=KDO-8-phosphate synthase; Short=KDO 8-P synthase; Short=KDOPS; AltName: Full=Phospho-2-dehydro-3-deoxyoctonate aldolase [Rickettsia felis URRWXCal2]AAY60964.1 3-deoxy-8-phosphooctulonate synthase [Rickettsia felis URRWXCal2]KHO03391.1 2-dehydro-3-deoxyphosphooctonate aldolase [Rickettsia feli
MQKVVKLNNIKIGNDLPFVLIAGPCQIEGKDHALFMAEKLVKLTSKLEIPFIYKSSFDKANRTSVNGIRGLGIEKGLEILSKVKSEFDCPIVTDVHSESQCTETAEIADILQIPAFLCRQTDLLQAAAKTGKIVKVKKGQFLAPWDMKNVQTKLEAFGVKDILFTERGACFGYNNLVSDMRSLAIIAELNVPVVFDATHSVQQPGGLGGSTGGERKYVELLAKAATAVGIAGMYMEVHQDPDNAPSDGPCMIKLDNLESILIKLKKYDKITKEK